MEEGQNEKYMDFNEHDKNVSHKVNISYFDFPWCIDDVSYEQRVYDVFHDNTCMERDCANTSALVCVYGYDDIPYLSVRTGDYGIEEGKTGTLPGGRGLFGIRAASFRSGAECESMVCHVGMVDI